MFDDVVSIVLLAVVFGALVWLRGVVKDFK